MLSEAEAVARANAKCCEPLERFPGGTKTLWRVRHECGSEFDTTAERLGDQRGGVCRDCGAARRRLKRSHSDESARAVIESVGADFIPDNPYPGNNRTPWPGKCSAGHDCSPTLGAIAKGTPPCPRCSGNRISDADALRRAEARGFVPAESYPGVGSLPWHGTCALCGEHLEVTGHSLGRGNHACEPCARRLAQRHRMLGADEAMHRARKKGCEPLEPYPGTANARWLVRHACGAEFYATAGELGRAGVGSCWKCGQASKTRKTIRECSEIAQSLGYEIVSWEMREASNALRPFLTIRCANGHGYVVAASMLRSGQRCRRCKDDARADANAQECRALASSRNEHVLRTWLQDRGNGRSRLWLEIRCPDELHPPFPMLAWNYKNDHGCPICNVGGGYDLDKPGSLYTVAGRGWFKIGIANRHRLSRRLNDHRRQGLDEVIATVSAENGSVAFDFERLWMIRRGGLAVLPTRDDIRDGWTESAPDTPAIRRWAKEHFLPLVEAAAAGSHNADTYERARQALPAIYEE